MERLKKESLNTVSTALGYMTRKEKVIKASTYCYVSYSGNRYSVPWKYEGRDCKIIEESSILKIDIDSIYVADHLILKELEGSQ
ncbi:Mu transposase domain-containing protein [Caldiplasma sukawensis]